MRGRATIMAAQLLVLTGGALHAHARDSGEISVGLSQDKVQITSTYDGTDLVLFGAVAHPAPGDGVVAVVRGPAGDIMVRRKARIAGIWLNHDSARLLGMASFYYLAATGDPAAIVPAALRSHNDLGLAVQAPYAARADGPVEPFRQAVLRQFGQQKLYDESGQVERLRGGLFRVHVPLPAAAPHGTYSVTVYLFRAGHLTGQQVTSFVVEQTGFDRSLRRLAHQWPWLYGLMAVLVAAVLGWLGSVLFRRRY